MFWYLFNKSYEINFIRENGEEKSNKGYFTYLLKSV